MPTNKLRFSITVDDELFKKIEDFRFEKRIKSQSKAVNQIMDIGFDALMGNEIKLGPDFSDFEIKMIKKYNALDKHGKEIIDCLLNKEYERCAASPAGTEDKSEKDPGDIALEEIERRTSKRAL